MIHIEEKKDEKNKNIFWLKDAEQYCLGFDSIANLKEHFRFSLKIEGDKITVIDEDKLLENILFV